MWNTSVKIEYIAGLIVEALENYSVNRENAQFSLVMEELRNHFTNCSEQEITDIISLCMKMYSSKKIEHTELVLTAPDSFRVKTLRTKDTMRNMIENTEKSLTITGYSISDYFAEMLDVIIKKSQQGVYVRIYVNDIEKQKEALDRLMSYRSRFLQIYEYQKQEDDKMAALHAVSLTIFIAIDNAQFVKFITEVQDKNSKIMPLAEMMILRNLMDNRKEQLSELSRKVQKSLDETKKLCNELVNRRLIEIVGKELC